MVDEKPIFLQASWSTLQFVFRIRKQQSVHNVKLYENTPMQHTAIFHCCTNDIFRLKFFDYFHIFAKNIFCGYTLEPVLTSTHNICFRAKIRKNVYPCKPQFYYIRAGCNGVFITRTCFHDDILLNLSLSEATTMR